MTQALFQELAELDKELLQLADVCEAALAAAKPAVFAPQRLNLPELRGLARKIQKQAGSMEQQYQQLLLLEQPVAQDLRKITGASRVLYDLERIGQQALNIGELPSAGEIPAALLQPLFTQTQELLQLSIAAFWKQSPELAQQAVTKDEAVNQLFKDLRRGLAQQLSQQPEPLLDQLLLGKYLEKIGDHAKNIAGFILVEEQLSQLPPQ